MIRTLERGKFPKVNVHFLFMKSKVKQIIKLFLIYCFENNESCVTFIIISQMNRISLNFTADKEAFIVNIVSQQA